MVFHRHEWPVPMIARVARLLGDDFQHNQHGVNPRSHQILATDGNSLVLTEVILKVNVDGGVLQEHNRSRP